MPRLIGSLQHHPDGWWIVGMADACFVEHGPYGRREEAQEDLVGLRRMYYDNRRYWDSLMPTLDANQFGGYNVGKPIIESELENQR